MQNDLGYKTLADIVMFYINVSGYNNDSIFSWTYVIGEGENKRNDSAAVREFRCVNNLQRGSMYPGHD